MKSFHCLKSIRKSGLSEKATKKKEDYALKEERFAAPNLSENCVRFILSTQNTSDLHEEKKK